MKKKKTICNHYTLGATPWNKKKKNIFSEIAKSPWQLGVGIYKVIDSSKANRMALGIRKFTIPTAADNDHARKLSQATLVIEYFQLVGYMYCRNSCFLWINDFAVFDCMEQSFVK